VTAAPPRARDPVLELRVSDGELTDRLLAPILEPWPLAARALLVVSAAVTALLAYAMAHTIATGIGTWGNNDTVAWAFGIVNFVMWIGIGHAGTFISAFLLLLEQRWRASINRIAEAMTIFAVVQAGLFPLLHLGRPWFFYWLLPYPATMRVWPQFRSALPWDIAAVGTYFTVSVLFWYVGLIPDLAAARDRIERPILRRVYGVLALGWCGSARHWRTYRAAYFLLAGIATPLVISVHSVVSLDFAISQVPGWHSTIFPPLFVAGALYSGFAMVLTLVVPIRRALHLEAVITELHLDRLAKMTLVTGWIVIYSYIVEHFLSWWSGDLHERFLRFHAWPGGEFATVYWLMLACNVLTPQLLWSRWVRRSPWVLFFLALAINVGMWSERFVIVVASLHRSYLPSSWKGYAPTWVDLSLAGGTVGFFLLLFLLFLRYVPLVPIAELRELKAELEHEEARA
jgi:molybdopterin-containing oxidoreductase family membrane subunit